MLNSILNKITGIVWSNVAHMAYKSDAVHPEIPLQLILVFLHREADQWAAEQRKQMYDAVQATATLARVQRFGPQTAT